MTNHANQPGKTPAPSDQANPEPNASSSASSSASAANNPFLESWKAWLMQNGIDASQAAHSLNPWSFLHAQATGKNQADHEPSSATNAKSAPSAPHSSANTAEAPQSDAHRKNTTAEGPAAADDKTPPDWARFFTGLGPYWANPLLTAGFPGFIPPGFMPPGSTPPPGFAPPFSGAWGAGTAPFPGFPSGASPHSNPTAAGTNTFTPPFGFAFPPSSSTSSPPPHPWSEFNPSDPASMLAAFEPETIEKRIQELKIISQWLSSTLQCTQATMQLLTWQKEAMAHFKAAAGQGNAS